jgi:hypothetical protein
MGMNPNFLFKDELLYELGIRGISSRADTSSLRKSFRAVISRDLPLHQRLDVIEQTMAMAGQAEQSTREMSRTPVGDVERNSHREEVRSPSVISSLPFSSDIYQAIENPLNYLLKQVQIVDGNDADCLCVFFLKALNIINIAQISVPRIYEILLPHCRGELLGCLHQALTTCEVFDLFHARVLRRFISDRYLTQLRLLNYERVQRDGEPLAVYVQSVRDAALYLHIKETEQLTVARIVEGLTPIQRTRFCFQTLPTTFVQLEQLAVIDRNVTYADQLREGATSIGVSSVQSCENNVAVKPPNSAVRQTQNQGNQRVCFKCVKPGHVQRCFVRSSSRT